MQQDLTDAALWLIENKISPKEKIAIYGASYGGYASLLGLGLTPDLYACGVSLFGPANLTNFMENVPPYWSLLKNELSKRIGGDPETKEGREVLKLVSPLFYAQQIKKPLLLVQVQFLNDYLTVFINVFQGKNDPRVGANETMKMIEILKKHKVPYTYIFYLNEGHGIAMLANLLLLARELEIFFGKCLGGKISSTLDYKAMFSGATIERFPKNNRSKNSG